MQTISRFMANDHKRCDELFASAETSVSNSDWTSAEAALQEFSEGLERHFAMEETVLFLAFEKAIGSSEGPTNVMRMEHKQLRAILGMLQESLAARDAEGFLGYSETLNTMMQQHNMKEESILYLMTDRVLSGQHDEIIGAMDGIGSVQ
ncbi:MAG TPA: hemerythrin domain-containing protein [Noviherbaspirillum sp.]